MPPLILGVFIGFLGEEATVALFLSLCNFAIRSGPLFAALTEVPSPATPVVAAAPRVISHGASSTYVSSGVRLTESLINQAYEAARLSWSGLMRGHESQMTTENLRAALKVIKDCGKDVRRVEEAVRSAARQPRPPPVNIHPNGNLLLASENVVIASRDVSGFLLRNSLVVRKASGNSHWTLYQRLPNGSETRLGDIAVMHQRTPNWLVNRIRELLTAARLPIK